MARLPAGSPPVVNTICEADVILGLSPKAIESHGGQAWLQERIAWVTSSDALPMARTSKGRDRTVDLRPLILDLRLAEEAERARMVEAGVPGSWVLVRLHHGLTSQGTVRLDEVVALLSSGEPLAHRAVRLTLRGPGGASVMPGGA
jgi:hypothetical protein